MRLRHFERGAGVRRHGRAVLGLRVRAARRGDVERADAGPAAGTRRRGGGSRRDRPCVGARARRHHRCALRRHRALLRPRGARGAIRPGARAVPAVVAHEHNGAVEAGEERHAPRRRPGRGGDVDRHVLVGPRELAHREPGAARAVRARAGGRGRGVCRVGPRAQGRRCGRRGGRRRGRGCGLRFRCGRCERRVRRGRGCCGRRRRRPRAPSALEPAICGGLRSHASPAAAAWRDQRVRRGAKPRRRAFPHHAVCEVGQADRRRTRGDGAAVRHRGRRIPVGVACRAAAVLRRASRLGPRGHGELARRSFRAGRAGGSVRCAKQEGCQVAGLGRGRVRSVRCGRVLRGRERSHGRRAAGHGSRRGGGCVLHAECAEARAGERDAADADEGWQKAVAAAFDGALDA